MILPNPNPPVQPPTDLAAHAFDLLDTMNRFAAGGIRRIPEPVTNPYLGEEWDAPKDGDR